MYASSTELRGPSGALPTRLERRELQLVVRCVGHARRRNLSRAARAITRAGNGGLYPIASAFLFAVSPQHALRCLAAAAMSLGLAFAVYPKLKRITARERPCEKSAFVPDCQQPLDRYSFPSGHAMTAAAFGFPIVVVAPASLPIVMAGFALVSWSRIALGHHYLSDIVGGAILGAGIAATVCAILP